MSLIYTHIYTHISIYIYNISWCLADPENPKMDLVDPEKPDFHMILCSGPWGA